MPEPIRSSASPNQSYYDSSEPMPDALPGAVSASPAPATGKDLLLKKYGSGHEDCTKHLIGAAVSFVVAGTGVAVGVATAPTGLGPVAGMVSAAGGIIKGAAELAAYLNCEDDNERMRHAAEQCGAQGGALFAGEGDSDAICVVPRS
jgi:hypothetical protein